jgi:SPP1 gp7 family putative phage head morphogenesis protein
MPLPDIDELWDEEEEKSHFSSVIFPFLILGFLRGSEKVAVKVHPDQMLTPTKRFAYITKSLKYAAQTVGTTKEALQKQINEALANEESVQQLAKRIKDNFGKMESYRAVRIARTQLTTAMTDGTLETLKAEGHETKEWSTVIDGRERETHNDANGQTVPIDGQFRVGGSMCDRPGDDNLPPEEVINCRCDVIAGGESRARKIYLGRLFLRLHGALERRYVLNLRRAFRSQRDRILSHFPSPHGSGS